MGRHRVCLTFDFDAFSATVRTASGTLTQLSRDEFAAVGALRVLDLLGTESVLATWFIPGHTLETFPDHCRRIVAAGHEIAHHGYLHEPPGELTREEEAHVLDRGTACIAALTGGPAVGYRSPSWDLSPHSVELLNAKGFLYDSSLMADDYTPYRVRLGDRFPADGPPEWGPPTNLIEIPVSWSLDDYPHFEYVAGRLVGLRSAASVLENFVGDFVYMTRVMDAGVITYTFHPEVIGRGHRMLMLEALIQRLKKLGAEFVRADAVAREAQQRLE